MKQILLTGGSGFIGRNILESFLAEKYEILAPKSTELNLIDTNCVDAFFKCHDCFDVVIHSAVKAGHRNAKDTNNLFYSNVRMFQNLERQKDKYGKFINLGSGAVYDMQNYQPKMKEDFVGMHIPVDEHGFCKYVVNKQIEQLDNFVDLRIFGIFGKYEDYAIRFISHAICKTLFNLPITIKQNRKLDYLYIDDLMPILEFFIENDVKYKSYNITPDKSIELFELAEIIKNITMSVQDIVINKTGLDLEYSGDNERIKTEYKDVKFTQINDSVYSLYCWYKQNLCHINRDFLLIDK